MAALGPFERRPHLAVAVSGGRDSLALTLLTQQWLAERGGKLQALIVDHRLRAQSTEEARHVAGLLHRLGIAADILTWESGKPSSGISEAARSARYALLERRCRQLGILHLLLGHQADDQAETVLLRLADASGPEGLAGMGAIVERSHVRVLRPLLSFPRARLAATVVAHGLDWVDDPSNDVEDYARVRIRRALDNDGAEACHDIAARAAAVRHAADQRVAGLLADMVSVDPAGFAWLDRRGFSALPVTIARRLLGRLAACFGGRTYPARQAGLDHAGAALRQGRNAVAGGCLFAVRGERVLICREAGAIGPAVAVRQGQSLNWDRRYRVIVPQNGMLGALGSQGRLLALRAGADALRRLPAVAAAALPGLWRQDRLAAVFLPDEAGGDDGSGHGRAAGVPATLICCGEARFRPSRSLAAPAWPLVLPPAQPMYLDRQTFSLRGRP